MSIECAICLENVFDDDTKFTTVCNHVFHCECIKTLNKCPLCRRVFQTEIFNLWNCRSINDPISVYSY